MDGPLRDERMIILTGARWKINFKLVRFDCKRKKSVIQNGWKLVPLRAEGSDAEWQMPLKISMYFLGLLPYSQLPPVEKTNSKYWSDEKLLSIKFVKKITISNLKVKKLYKSKRKAMFESLGSKIGVFF